MPADGTVAAIAPAEISASFPRQRQLKKNTPLYDDVTTTIDGDRAPESVQIGHFRAWTVHRSEIFLLMSVQGQNEKPPVSGLMSAYPSSYGHYAANAYAAWCQFQT
jgi:hypothetical protein